MFGIVKLISDLPGRADSDRDKFHPDRHRPQLYQMLASRRIRFYIERTGAEQLVGPDIGSNSQPALNVNMDAHTNVSP
jgi:hypothetical protein